MARVFCLLLGFAFAIVSTTAQGRDGFQGGQTAADDSRFEVASVRPNRSGADSGSVGAQQGGRFVALNASPLQLIRWSFRMEAFRVAGAPGWASSERYDVVAAADPVRSAQPGAPARMYSMAQNLLADRFKLVVHRETRPLQVYALVRSRSDGKLGAQIEKTDVDCDALLKKGVTPDSAPRTLADFSKAPTCGIRGGSGLYAAGNVTLAEFTEMLKSTLDTAVVDRTELQGKYNITLKWNPDLKVSTTDSSVPVLFTAIEDQLGLKLVRRTEPIEVLVIDSIERPTAN